MPERFEGKTIELISFEDSIPLAATTITNGQASFETVESDSVKFPLLAQLVVDGRVKGFYVIEPGKARLDSTDVAVGTPLNDRLGQLMARLDSADATGDMDFYVLTAEKIYNENKENTLGSYFGIEWLKYADPAKVDSMMKEAPKHLRESRRAEHYLYFARLRTKTSPGKQYTDFTGEDAKGNPVNLSRYVNHDGYTLVDFMASWCPYCIKDMPKLKALQEEYGSKGLKIVSVAVRDKSEDTAAAVERHGIDWDVVYNTGKAPYDIYGFSGIPHYILIGPDAKIIARSESLDKIQISLRKI